MAFVVNPSPLFPPRDNRPNTNPAPNPNRNNDESEEASIRLAIALQLQEVEAGADDFVLEEYRRMLLEAEQILEDRRIAEALGQERNIDEHELPPPPAVARVPVPPAPAPAPAPAPVAPAVMRTWLPVPRPEPEPAAVIARPVTTLASVAPPRNLLDDSDDEFERLRMTAYPVRRAVSQELLDDDGDDEELYMEPGPSRRPPRPEPDWDAAINSPRTTNTTIITAKTATAGATVVNREVDEVLANVVGLPFSDSRVGGPSPSTVLSDTDFESDFDSDFESDDEDLKLAIQMSLAFLAQQQEEQKQQEQQQKQGPDPGAVGSPSSSGKQVQIVDTQPTIECTSCTDPTPENLVIKTPCLHPYCRACLKTLFVRSCVDEELFPPRCCNTDIPLFLVNSALTAYEKRVFREKILEYTSKDRKYCSNRTCSAFLSPSSKSAGEILICRICKHGTCSMCEGPEHVGDCPEDQELTLTLEKAAAEGWQRCRNCKALVEHTYGCNHMTCRCGSQWCFRCGDKWKTCKCSDWERGAGERRTVAELRMEGEAAAAAVGGEAAELARRRRERETKIAGEVESCSHGMDGKGKHPGGSSSTAASAAKGKERAATSHGEGSSAAASTQGMNLQLSGSWTYKTARAACEVCKEVMKDYILVCSDCGMEVCSRCKRETVDVIASGETGPRPSTWRSFLIGGIGR